MTLETRSPSPADAVVDVRGMPCVVRHAAVMDRFDALRPGESLVIVNDHDPGPLRTRFELRAAWDFVWDCETSESLAWLVRVTRR